MKCPKCGSELVFTPMSLCFERPNKKNWCPKCHCTIKEK